jgi:hypothetical protein
LGVFYGFFDGFPGILETILIGDLGGFGDGLDERFEFGLDVFSSTLDLASSVTDGFGSSRNDLLD